MMFAHFYRKKVFSNGFYIILILSAVTAIINCKQICCSHKTGEAHSLNGSQMILIFQKRQASIPYISKETSNVAINILDNQ